MRKQPERAEFEYFRIAGVQSTEQSVVSCEKEGHEIHASPEGKISRKEEDMDNYINFTIEPIKDVALIAHDNEKPKLIEWCKANYDRLKNHRLYGTGTTARLITEKTGLTVKGYNSGPLGGDQQIGAKIVEGVIDFVVFFSDPLTAQPHDPDVKALLRIAQVYDIPIAVNKATADFIITSKFMDSSYDHQVINFNKNVEERAKNM